MTRMLVSTIALATAVQLGQTSFVMKMLLTARPYASARAIALADPIVLMRPLPVTAHTPRISAIARAAAVATVVTWSLISVMSVPASGSPHAKRPMAPPKSSPTSRQRLRGGWKPPPGAVVAANCMVDVCMMTKWSMTALTCCTIAQIRAHCPSISMCRRVRLTFQRHGSSCAQADARFHARTCDVTVLPSTAFNSLPPYRS